jgi:hypothetical protein
MGTTIELAAADQRGSLHAESAKLARTRTLEFLRRYVG